MTDDLREELLDGWELAAPGWGRQADAWARATAPVTAEMLGLAALAPGDRVLELAAGPGDLSLAAAVQVAPTRVLCSDGVEAMVEVARERAAELGVENVEFQRLQLEWIDLPAASVDVILCRFGLMLTVDPGAALQECRRVLAPGGRLVLAVQGPAPENPWLTGPWDAAAQTGRRPADTGGASAPGPFALADPAALTARLEEAGFFDPTLSTVPFHDHFTNALDWLGEKLDHSPSFAALWRDLDDPARRELRAALEARGAHFAGDHGLSVPGLALVAGAVA